MTIARHVVTACCGSSSLILTLDKPIRKSQMKVFRDAGYFIPDNFFNAGILYVQNQQLIATSSFGTTKINLRCGGSDCESKIADFEHLLEQAINLI